MTENLPLTQEERARLEAMIERRDSGERRDRPRAERRRERRYSEEPTARERELLVLLADGLDNAEIAGRLQLSVDTVKSHLRNILDRLGARNRTHAVAIALRKGYIQ